MLHDLWQPLYYVKSLLIMYFTAHDILPAESWYFYEPEHLAFIMVKKKKEFVWLTVQAVTAQVKVFYISNTTPAITTMQCSC